MTSSPAFDLRNLLDLITSRSKRGSAQLLLMRIGRYHHLYRGIDGFDVIVCTMIDGVIYYRYAIAVG